MASNFAQGQAGASSGEALLALIAAEGSVSHPYLCDEAAFAGGDATRNLADAVYFLCMLHGRHPGLIDHAAEANACAVSQRWLGSAASAFSGERLYVTRLAVAAGPVPSTPGSAESEAAVAGQCHALQMLARSERSGCPLGATVALVIDWQAVRPLLDRAAARFGIEAPPCRLPHRAAAGTIVDQVGGSMSVRRALAFGAGQLLVQHRGLFDLLDARQSARRDS